MTSNGDVGTLEQSAKDTASSPQTPQDTKEAKKLHGKLVGQRLQAAVRWLPLASHGPTDRHGQGGPNEKTASTRRRAPIMMPSVSSPASDLACFGRSLLDQ